MKCAICRHGETSTKTITLSLQHGGNTVTFKEVTAEVCDNCGEYYLDADTTNRMLEQTESRRAA